MAFPLKSPWKTCPPNPVPFDRSNALGRACRWALVPGFFSHVSATSAVAALRSVGFPTDDYTLQGNGQNLVTIDGENFGRYSCKAAIHDIASHTTGAQWESPLGSGAIEVGSVNFSYVLVWRPIGAGRIGASPATLFAKGSGTAGGANDIRFQISTGNDFAMNLRRGGAVQTITGVTNIVSDALCVMAGGARPVSSTNNEMWTRMLVEDGTFEENSGNSSASTYNPRTTTGYALGNSYNAGAAAYPDAEFVGAFAFDREVVLADMQQLLDNPWQVFKPRQLFLPAEVGVITASGAPSTPVVEAAGTALRRLQASGAASVAPVEAAGTSLVRKVASGAPSIPAVQAAGTALVIKKASGVATVPAVIAAGTASVPGVTPPFEVGRRHIRPFIEPFID